MTPSWARDSAMAPEPVPTPTTVKSVSPQSGRVWKIAAGLVLIAALAFGLRSLLRSKPLTSDAQNSAAPASQPAAATELQKGTLPGSVTERALPTVSQGARNTIQGRIRVAVRVSVDTTGNVSEAKLTSPGPSKYFANQALQSARRWKFKPPQVDGQPTASAWLLRDASVAAPRRPMDCATGSPAW